MTTTKGEIEIRTVSTADELVAVVDLLKQVWGSSTELVRLEMLLAIAHSGGYVSAAYTSNGPDPSDQIIVGASVAILARHRDQPALHSHVTGLLPDARHLGIGRAIKMHQRDWAAKREIDWIVWTFDPLVRRNAWFNIAILGAKVQAYLPSFYGTMTDAINAGDDSDRLLMEWDVRSDPSTEPLDGSDIDDLGQSAQIDLVPTPADVVALRRTDPTAVAEWRQATRNSLTAALNTGRPIVGFTSAGEYVIGARP